MIGKLVIPKMVLIAVVGIVVLSGLLPAAHLGISEKTTKQFPLIGHSNTAWVRDYGDHRIIFVRGNHYEMGYQHGAMLADDIYKTLYAYINAVGESEQELLQVYANGEPYIPQEYKDEMQGLADGSHVDINLIHAAHAIPTLHHCSGFGVWGNATVDGKVYHTRSLDYGVTIADPNTGETIQMHSAVIVRKPKNGYISMVPAWIGFIGSVDGMNEKKISIGEMGQGTDDHTQHGLFMIFRLRYALEHSANMSETIYNMGINRTYGYSFIVADGNINKAQMLEMTWHHYYHGYWDDIEEANGYSEEQYQIPDVVRRGNHMIAYQTAMTQRDVYLMMPTNSDYLHLINYLNLSYGIEKNYGKIDFDKAQEIFTNAYRRYPLQFTLHQVIFDPADLKMRVADAYPEGTGAFWNTFYEYSLPNVLSMPEILNISNPTNGSSVSGTVTITPNILSGYTPNILKLYVDGVEVGNITSPPYQFNWDSTTVTNGAHVLEIRAFGDNFSAIAYITVNVNNLISNPIPLKIHYRSFEINSKPITIEDMYRNLQVPHIYPNVHRSKADWTINTTVYLNDTTKIVNGNVIITDGGKLEMKNSTLIINSTVDGMYGLIVDNGGSFIMMNSTLKNYSARIYTFFNSTAKEVKIINSEISGGGYSLEKSLLYIACDNVTVENSTIIHNGFGLVINGINKLTNVHIRNVTLYIRNILHLPVASIYVPRGASILLGNVVNGTVENISIHGIDYGKLLSFGVLLISSSNCTVKNIFVEHEFIGIGFMNSENNYAENITVLNSHIGGGFLMNAKYNEICDIRMEHGAGGIADVYNAPYNIIKNAYINDTSLAAGAQDSDGVKYENLTIENSLGGIMCDKAENVTFSNVTIHAIYSGVILKSYCHNAVFDGLKIYVEKDLFGIGVRKSKNVTFRNTEVHGVRYVMHIEGDDPSQYIMNINNFTTDYGALKYYHGSVPSNISGGEIIITDISNTNLNLNTAHTPIYLAYVTNVSINLTSTDPVSGIMLYHSSSVGISGRITNSSTYGVMLYDVNDAEINVDVNGSCWAYALHYSHNIFIKGKASNLKDSAIYSVYSEFTADINATESNYGLIGRFSTMYILRNVPSTKYYYTVYNSTVYLCNYLHVYVLYANNTPIEGAMVNISFNGVLITTAITDSNGYAKIVAPYAIWNLGMVENNLTTIEVHYGNTVFDNNPRTVDMSSERTETFKESAVPELWLGFLVILVLFSVAILRKKLL